MADEPRKRLLRSRDERVLAGVAGGIAAYLDVDPTLVRVGFVVAALFGGLGVAAYLILAVVTPNDDGSGAPAEDRPSVWLLLLGGGAVWAFLALRNRDRGGPRTGVSAGEHAEPEGRADATAPTEQID